MAKGKKLFPVCLLCLFVIVVSGASPLEVQALTDFYNSCCGSGWSSSVNWLDGDPCNNNWEGVFCSGNNIVSLELPSHGVCGDIPDSISDLQYIESFLLDNNAIQSIPPALWDLPNLNNITFAYNEISSELSSHIGNSVGIRSINLQYNQIIGVLPDALSNLVNLDAFLVNNNNLTGEIPASYSSLVRMEQFYIGSNDIDGVIPSGLAQWTSLNTFDVSNNQLEGNLLFLQNLTALRIVTLFGNKFNGTLPSLVNLNQLVIFEAYDNELGGKLEFPFFGSLLLRTFDVSGNMLTGDLPVDMYDLSVLSTVNMARNKFSGAVGTFSSSSLNFLDLSDNQFSGNLNQLLYYSSSISHIDISSNQFTGTIPTKLGLLTTAKSCNMSHNEIYGDIPGEFTSITGLIEFSIAHNQMQQDLTIALNRFNVSGLLKELDLSYNQFTGVIPPGISYFADTLMESMDLSFNKLTGNLPSIDNLSFLVNISGNNFTCPFPDSWMNSEVTCTVNCCSNFVESPQQSENGTDGYNDDNPNLTPLWITLGIMCGILVIVVAAGGFYGYKRYKTRKEAEYVGLD